MRENDLVIFLPCRAGSTRVLRKNTRPFAGRSDGLLGIKLDHLERLDVPGRIILDSNDPECRDIGDERRRTWQGTAELIVRERPDELGRSSTTTDSLIRYALETIDAATLLWTHVTSPLVDEVIYREALRRYSLSRLEGHDSLMTVTALHGFIWSQTGPVNYSLDELRWPRTQDLEPLYEVNSAVFIVDMATARRRQDRIGDRPYLMPLDRTTAVDIDNEGDFTIAERMYEQLPLMS